MSRQDRLSNKRDFDAIFRTGSRFVGRYFSIQVLRTENASQRMAFSVGKKIGNAVCRNRIRRRLREACRKNARCLTVGADMVFIARSPILTASFHDMESEVKRFFGEIEKK